MDLQDCTVFIEKNPCTSGPMSFKPMLFKGQVYGAFRHSIHCPTAAAWSEVRVSRRHHSWGRGVRREALDSQDLMPAPCGQCQGWTTVDSAAVRPAGVQTEQQETKRHSQDSNPARSDSKDSTLLSSIFHLKMKWHIIHEDFTCQSNSGQLKEQFHRQWLTQLAPGSMQGQLQQPEAHMDGRGLNNRKRTRDPH